MPIYEIIVAREDRGYRAHCGLITATGSTPERARQALIDTALQIAAYTRTTITLADHRRIEISADHRGYAADEYLANGTHGRSLSGPLEDEAWRFAAYLVNRDPAVAVISVFPKSSEPQLVQYVAAKLPTALERAILQPEQAL